MVDATHWPARLVSAIDLIFVPTDTCVQALNYLDYLWAAVFGLEAILKIIVHGFAFNGKDSYMRNGWNVLDFLVVLSSFAIIATDSALGPGAASQLSALRALRTLRALRPLKAAKKYEGMRTVITALFTSIKPLANVGMVGLLFYLTLAILGVNLFGGQFYSCTGASSKRRVACTWVSTM